MVVVWTLYRVDDGRGHPWIIPPFLFFVSVFDSPTKGRFCCQLDGRARAKLASLKLNRHCGCLVLTNWQKLSRGFRKCIPEI